ncbi:Gmad2 immunoglobulin-like domain-containing protein [Phycicoccus duodecadis]|uniref:Immunoglobulin-like protein involved in spore germination n=1 Tax=Phycicoccus duodecadis TaxID=173053 RepID=A0A2N3YMX5_9MICO|nr:Gmad2 immunoglobulin-like domain-containing protein [Phycicoccus duodecadis]PKW28184.1 immunoglobulin-like protein involved in spore germination [Phycicoccus duodecadis]
MDPMTTSRDEERLRAALRGRAHLVDPPDRLDDVLEVARSRRARRWAPLVAAAAVAAVVGGVWVVHPFGTERAATPAMPLPSASPLSSPAPSASTTSIPTATPSTSPAPSVVAAGGPVPVYVVGSEVVDVPDGRFGLRRAWVATAATAADQRVRVAVDAALDAPVPLVDTPPWEGVDVSRVRVTASGVTVDLSGPAQPVSSAVDSLALDQVGWTAQAVLGRGNLPVTVRAGGQVLRVVTRPPADQWWTVLADVWITSPTAGAVVPAGRPVVVRGEASVFEASLSVTVVPNHSQAFPLPRPIPVTASAGAPARGTYSVDLGRLAAGSYSVRVVALSPKDGSASASDVVSFTVR